jgi:hypothetical protein
MPQRNGYRATEDKMLDYIVTHLSSNERQFRVIFKDDRRAMGLRLGAVSMFYPKPALV